MPGMDFFSRFGQGTGPNVNPMGGLPGGAPQTGGGLMNPSAMQFLNFMMTQPGANYDQNNLPGFGTPWAFGVPQTVTAPTPRPMAPAPAPAPVPAPMPGSSKPPRGSGSER